jgi:hypothetical protein
MRELKVSTSMWMKASGLFPEFDGWADGFSRSIIRKRPLKMSIEI